MSKQAQHRPWTEHEVDLMRRFYQASGRGPVDLHRLAQLLGREKANVCRKARLLGFTNQSRAKNAQPLLPTRVPTAEETKQKQRSAAIRRIQKNGHPRGMLGKRHSLETKMNIASSSRAMWADPNSRINSPELAQLRSDAMIRRIENGQMRSGYSRAAGGRRPDLEDIYFRSSWEANYARYLNWLIGEKRIVCWFYESRTFVFEPIKRGTRAYTPDFEVWFEDGHHEWHEVKGWMDAKSATRLTRMAKYYPGEHIEVIGPDWFRSAQRSGLANMIPNWERGGKRVRQSEPSRPCYALYPWAQDGGEPVLTELEQLTRDGLEPATILVRPPPVETLGAHPYLVQGTEAVGVQITRAPQRFWRHLWRFEGQEVWVYTNEPLRAGAAEHKGNHHGEAG